MSTWDERMTPRARRPPTLELLEVCWRLVGPSDRLLECGLYRTDAGLELRCGYGADLLRSQLVDVHAAPGIAEKWKRAVLTKGSFHELTMDGT